MSRTQDNLKAAYTGNDSLGFGSGPIVFCWDRFNNLLV